MCTTAQTAVAPAPMLPGHPVVPVRPVRRDKPGRSPIDTQSPIAAPAATARAGAPADDAADRQRQLLKTGALQHAILKSASFSSIATDESGVIQIFNTGAERMLGYPAHEVIGRLTAADLADRQELVERAGALSAESAMFVGPGFEALVHKAARGVEDVFELTCRCKDGSRLPVLLSVTALQDADGAVIGYLLIGTDNTLRKRVQAQQLRLAEVLQQSHRDLTVAKLAAERANQAKSDFLSSMSHELRSPLNAILGFAQLIETGVPAPSPAQRESVDQILQAGWYLLKLINEILDLALIESGKLSLSPEPISLAEVLADCEAMIEPQARQAGIRLGFSSPGEDLVVKADRTRVKQVMINLLSNAIKYNRSAGRVDVRCQEVAAGRIRISVHDTGPGLHADELAQLFQPFNRLGQESGAHEGTGIGLVVSKRLTELMGGRIGADSEPGVGSVFWFELQATAPAELAPGADEVPPAPAAVPAAGAVPRTLLCVEDNPANLLLIEKLIARRADLRLLSASDGQRGIELARSARPDLILMDINLPGIDGLTALGLLRSDPATAHIPVIALSANAMRSDIERGLAAGFFRYLTKPLQVGEFTLTLDLALAPSRAEAGRVTEGALS